jgi:hypothetical protein
VSDCGLDYYSQGGVVVDGIAYFTADDSSRRPGFHGKESPDFPCAAAFGVEDYRIVRRYPVRKTYDSSPFVIQKRDGSWLVLAHEHQNTRTVAVGRDTGKIQWISVANQPGELFFGYSYFQCPDGSKLILMACRNGLHAVSSETGQDTWWVRENAIGGITPCVDQANGWVYYQCTGKVLKIRADKGEILKSTEVAHPVGGISGNTVLVKDSYGYFVATRWYGAKEWDSAIRVFDQNLNLLWERTKLPSGKKDTLTYANGKLVTGSGNSWSKNYTGHDWKYIAAYAIGSGRVIWKCGLDDHEYLSIANVPYYNGFFYAETQDRSPYKSKLFRIQASDGRLAEVLEYGRPILSCAPCIIARGKIFSGDLWEDRIVVTRIAENSKADWPGPFCHPQTNQNALPEESGAKCVPMQELARCAT